MRTVIFTLMLLAVNCLGAPQPTVWLNQFTTNRPPMGIVGTQTNSGRLDILLGGTFGGGLSAAKVGNYQFTVDGTDGHVNVGEGEAILSPGKLLLQSAGSFGIQIIDDGGNGMTFYANGSSGAVTNLGYMQVGGPMTNIGPIVPMYVTASKLASFDAAKNLTNGVYSDADIAALQAATNSLQTQLTAATNALNVASNALQALTLTTNKYILANAGLGTNNVLNTVTNTISTSNQTALTITGLAGQAGDYVSVWSNSLFKVFSIDRLGNIVISNSSPSITFSNNAHKFSIGTSDGFNLSIQQDGSQKAQLNNSGNWDSLSFSENGTTFLDSSRNGKNFVSLGVGVATALGKVHITNSSAQVALRVDTTATNDPLAVYRGTTLLAGVSSNGVYSLASNLVAPTAITFPNSTVNWTNPLNCNIELYIDNTAVTGTAIKKNGTQIFGGLSNDVVMHLQPGEYFSETYSVGTPSATFSPF